jgi:ATP-binding cassette, subfamily B, bacterial CvaB/MchF/RaxB
MLDLGLVARRRVRLIRQVESAECGLAALAMVANFHGLDFDLGVLRRRFPPSVRGTSLRSLMDLSDRIGFSPRAIKVQMEGLSELHIPCILHWGMNHFVVLEKVSGDKALIHNPTGRSGWMAMSEVSEHFTGVALELRPNDRFETGQHHERLRLSQIWGRMSGLKRALAQTLLLTCILQAYVLVLPYYMQISIDSVLPSLDSNLLIVLAIGFGALTLFNAGATLLRSFVLLVAGTTVGFSLASSIAWRLFRLPIDWFEKRHTGDVLSRFQSTAPIKEMLTQGALSAIVDGVMAVLILAMMFWYSAVLAFVAIIAFGLYCVVRAVSFSLERSAREMAIVAMGREQTTLIESLRGITTLRLSGREALRHAVWQARLTDSINADVHVARIKIWQNTAEIFIFGIENIISVYIAINLVIGESGFSVGMIFAYIAYKGQFIQKSSSFIENAVSFKMLNLHLERLSDIALSDEDISFTDNSAIHNELKGRIELKNVVYRYSPADPIVLDNLNLMVEPGEFVAITGASGGGKSTMVKLMLGLIEPVEGQILVDGLPLRQFGYKNYHRQIAAVLQDDQLFAGTFAENITLFDENLDFDLIVEVAKIAAIHDDIAKMPMRYETLVGDMGSTLSGGQKQRILLARALYRKPKVLILDEGTAHLDSNLERMVNSAIASMGITRVIIAHREQTIAAAEKVFVMEDGKLSKT